MLISTGACHRDAENQANNFYRDHDQGISMKDTRNKRVFSMTGMKDWVFLDMKTD